MKTTGHPFKPDYACHPGLSLADALREIKVSIPEAAKRLGMFESYISDVAQFGKAPITPELALRLETILHIGTEQFWNNSQANYVADCKRLGFWDIFVVEWESRKIDHAAGTALPVKGSFHTVGKRLAQVMEHINDKYSAYAVPAGLFKKGDILPENVEEWSGQQS